MPKDETAIKPYIVLDDNRPSESLCPFGASLAHGALQLWGGQEAGNGLRKSSPVARGNQQAGIAVNDCGGQAADFRRHHRRAAGHRF